MTYCCLLLCRDPAGVGNTTLLHFTLIEIAIELPGTETADAGIKANEKVITFMQFLCQQM